ncbi:MarR family winged helix-turn-helix transcriptional regulator [Amycolatopsis sp. NBC_00345]|uniref:MarR family winged helix-turn-helix transcriptional regulator n=1 Tax=Amycolatopsis sp. NBC_00345 TaxID=2975955 RepID=UPI002E2543A7
MADGPQPDQVGLRFLSQAYRVRKVLDEHMVASGLSLARTKVLQVLDRTGSIRQASLAGELGFAQRTVTQTVESLERDKLVERRSDPSDGRAKLVALTEAGATALAASTRAGDQLLQRIFGSLDPEQLAGLAELLDAIDLATGAG